MSLSDYIKGNRYGKKAHRLEYDAMRDPFLQDAIDGYLESDRPTYHLKKLTNGIKKRTRNKYYRLQTWGIVACALLIICLSIFFFVYDSDNKTNFPEKSTYAETGADDSSARNYMIDSLTVTNSEQTATDPASIDDDTVVVGDNKEEVETINLQTDLLATIEKLTVQQENQQERRRRSEEDQRIADRGTVSNQRQNDFLLDQRQDNSNEYTLTNSEIQQILSEYDFNETSSDATDNQPPKPAVGDQAYNDYIKRNLNLLMNNAGEKQRGKVILLFSVNENGRPTNITVLRSLSQAADREAIRLLQNGPNWTMSDKSASLEINF